MGSRWIGYASGIVGLRKAARRYERGSNIAWNGSRGGERVKRSVLSVSRGFSGVRPCLDEANRAGSGSQRLRGR